MNVAVEIYMHQNSDHHLSSLPSHKLLVHCISPFNDAAADHVRAIVNPNINILYCTGNAIQTLAKISFPYHKLPLLATSQHP